MTSRMMSFGSSIERYKDLSPATMARIYSVSRVPSDRLGNQRGRDIYSRVSIFLKAIYMRIGDVKCFEDCLEH